MVDKTSKKSEESKTKTKRPSKGQRKHIRRLKQAGTYTAPVHKQPA
jgi:hypothetical protein